MREAPRPLSVALHRIFRAMLLVVPIGVLGNVAFSLLSTDRDLLSRVAEFPRGYLLLAVALGLLPWFTNALRLLIWVRFLGHRLRYRETLQIVLAVDLGSAVTPTAVGGGFFKWGMLVQRGVSPGAAASLTSLPTLEDGIFFGIAIPVALVLSSASNQPALQNAAQQLRTHGLGVAIFAAAVAAATWAAVRLVLSGGLGTRTQRRGLRVLARTRRRLRATWVDAREVFRLIRRNGKSRFAITLALTGIQWVARYSVITALVAFLGAPVDPVLFWLLQWVVFTLMNFIPTPGAAGGAEAAFYVIYSAFLPGRIIGLATAGWRFLTFYLQLSLASVLFYLLGPLDGRPRTEGV